MTILQPWHDQSLTYAIDMWATAGLQRCRPSMILNPRLSIDGNQWCALYGDNIQDGVAGFGDSPELAYEVFDKAWGAPLKGGDAA